LRNSIKEKKVPVRIRSVRNWADSSCGQEEKLPDSKLAKEGGGSVKDDPGDPRIFCLMRTKDLVAGHIKEWHLGQAYKTLSYDSSGRMKINAGIDQCTWP